MVADYIVGMLWPPLGHVLEYAASVAIDHQHEPSKRRVTRKSESLNALFKSCALKIPPIFSTIYLASTRLGWRFVLLTIVYLVLTTGFTVVLVASAKMVQAEKARKDDT